jgi:hypothetical protein
MSDDVVTLPWLLRKAAGLDPAFFFSAASEGILALQTSTIDFA